MKNPFTSLILTKRQIRRTFIYKVFGKGVFAPDLWRFERESLAGGLALGLFIAFTPSIPFQMIMAAFGALYFRVNLPVALSACWVTNPLTAPTIYLTGFRLGRRIMAHLPWVEDLLIFGTLGGRFNAFLLQAITLWAGCIVLGALAALAGSLLIRVFWQDKEDTGAKSSKPTTGSQKAAREKVLNP